MFMHRWLRHPSAADILPNGLIITVTIVALIFGYTEVVVAGNTASAAVEFAVDEISAMEVVGTLSGPVTLTSPETGDAKPAGDSNTYIRYTSLVPSGETRTLSAAIKAGTIPAGCSLRLEVVGLSGKDDSGAAVPGELRLSNDYQQLVTGIGNCCTGTGSTDGVRLSYSLVVEDEDRLVPGEITTVVISFVLD